MNGMEIVTASEYVAIAGRYFEVPAKIDTGAGSTAVWASDINVDEKSRLHFKLFAPESEFYDGKEFVTEDFSVGIFRSSHGHEQVRYRVKLELEMAGRKIETLVSLADRKRNRFPVLIGLRTLANNFLVDVSRSNVAPILTQPMKRLEKLKEEFLADKKAFHENHFEKEKL